MKNYFYSFSLMILAVTLTLVVPPLSDITSDFLIQYEIPLNNSAIAGVQKYNIPPVSENIPVPPLSSRSILLKDLATDTILFQKEADLRLPIASTTKIMTAMVASEYFKPNTPLTVKEGAQISGARVGLFKDEVLTFRSLLYGMLLNSGNDAAYTIAENYPGGIIGFITAMNKKSEQLNLQNTHFDNPAGFDSPRHFSSGNDLAKITQESLKNYQLARVFATKETEVVSIDKKYKHELKNLNKLLSQVSGVLGVKTGYSKEAKENLITLVEREGHQVLVIVLGSDDRFGESTKLIEWAYDNFNWFD